MDPEKSASAPPSGGVDAKSSMGQAAPPPYQDGAYTGYPQPGQGYPPQAQPGYGAPMQYGGAGYGQQPYAMGQQYPGQQYPGQPGPVTVQPTVYVTQGPLANPVNDYLCYSIFITLFCCLPLGIAGLVYSISTREANRRGDQLMAERASSTAKILNHVGLGLGIGVIIFAIVYVVVVLSVWS